MDTPSLPKGFEVVAATTGEVHDKVVDLTVTLSSAIDNVDFEAHLVEIRYTVKNEAQRRLEIAFDLSHDDYLVVRNNWMFGLNPDSFYPDEDAFVELDPDKTVRMTAKLKPPVQSAVEAQAEGAAVVAFVDDAFQKGSSDVPLLDPTSYLYLAVLQEHPHADTEGTFLVGFQSRYFKEW